MTILTKEADLLKFINEKKLSNINTSQKELYGSFTKMIISSLINCYSKIVKVDITIKCVNTIYILFWFLIEYSKNTKLSSFLCDRAILLFTEYILMISSPIVSNVKLDIDITEVKTFVYKKTIGPLPLNTIKKKLYFNKYYKFIYIIKELYSILFLKIEKYYNNKVDIKIITDTFNNSEYCLNKYIIDEIFVKNNMINVDTKLLEIFITQTSIESIDYIQFTNSIIIMIIASKLYNRVNVKYIDEILFLINEKYPKEIINFTVIDKINVYTELDKIHKKLS